MAIEVTETQKTESGTDITATAETGRHRRRRGARGGEPWRRARKVTNTRERSSGQQRLTGRETRSQRRASNVLNSS
jgi:hypothetical protein